MPRITEAEQQAFYDSLSLLDTISVSYSSWLGINGTCVLRADYAGGNTEFIICIK